MEHGKDEADWSESTGDIEAETASKETATRMEWKETVTKPVSTTGRKAVISESARATS